MRVDVSCSARAHGERMLTEAGPGRAKGYRRDGARRGHGPAARDEEQLQVRSTDRTLRRVASSTDTTQAS